MNTNREKKTTKTFLECVAYLENISLRSCNIDYCCFSSYWLFPFLHNWLYSVQYLHRCGSAIRDKKCAQKVRNKYKSFGKPIWYNKENYGDSIIVFESFEMLSKVSALRLSSIFILEKKCTNIKKQNVFQNIAQNAL